MRYQGGLKHGSRSKSARPHSLGYGKAGQAFLENVVYRSLGVKNDDIVVGPRRGFDNAVIRLDDSRVMIVTTDPVSILPTLGMKESAWLSVHLIASDYATSSQAPEFASFDFNLPSELGTTETEEYLVAVGRECDRIGVSIVAGHTGSYPGAGFTVVGGGTMFGFAGREEYLDPSMSQPGDRVVMTKGAAIETTADLANSFPQFLKAKVGPSITARARQYTRLCTTFMDALTASSVGIKDQGVTAMHDATEGGVLGALSEMAHASRRAFVIDEDRIHVSEETRQTCAAFGIDPLVSLSEGTLLLTCKKEKTDELRKKMRRSGIPTFVIGRVAERGRGVSLMKGGRSSRFVSRRDPYWKAYERALRAGLT